MKSDTLLAQGLENIAQAIRSASLQVNWWNDRVIIAAIITGVCTIFAGIFVILAAKFTLRSVREQIQAQEKLDVKKRGEDYLSVLRAYMADIEAIVVACNEYINIKLDSAIADYKKGHLQTPAIGIFVPFSSRFYNELSKSNGILGPEIAAKISIFYNALPIYEQLMKHPISLQEFKNPDLSTKLKKNATELMERAKELKNNLENEIQNIQINLK